MTVQWCDPPRVGRPRTRRRDPQPQQWTQRLLPALERPGEWLKVRDDYFDPNGAYCAAQALRGGRSATDRPPGRWEFRAGQVARGAQRWGVWARWLGEDQ